MTQAHKTVGAIVVLRDDESNADMQHWIGPNWRDHKFEVLSDMGAGHIWTRSILDPTVEFRGWHEERYVTYRGDDLHKIKAMLKR